MPSDTLTVIDNRNGKKAELKIDHDTIKATDLFKNLNIRSYDPGYSATAAAKSEITWINGGEGILEYRGYPIEQLVQHSTFEEVAFLVLYGELPDTNQLTNFRQRIMGHTYVHEDLKDMMKNFRYNSHPMGMFISTISAESTIHPEANPALAGQDVYKNPLMRNKQIHRIIGNAATIAAFSYRHRVGRPYVNPAPPSDNMSYAENFMYMLDKMSHREYKPHPVLSKALDKLFILHIDHELNCSTSAMRHLASSGVDVYTAIAGAAAGLYGPRHGGANEAVLRMLESIGSVENVPAFVEKVKSRQVKLMGFGHRVYKNYDPRARAVRAIANDVFALLGKEPLVEVATALEKYALEDPYFIERKLYPNVDFYSGIIYKAMGFPTDFFPVLFTIPRIVGWLAHWNEFLTDKFKEGRIVRPRQIYVGKSRRDYVPVAQRPAAPGNLSSYSTAESKRRKVGELRARM